MNILDIVIAAILVIGFILGYKDGFVRKLIGTIGFVAAVYFSIRFSFDLGKAIENVLGNRNLSCQDHWRIINFSGNNDSYFNFETYYTSF